MLTIGVLAMQGGFAEHLERLRRLGNVKGIKVRAAGDLAGLDGLILPGGESTAMGKLLTDFGLLLPLAECIRSGMPVWGTCAGLILLAKRIAGQKIHYLAVMDIGVCRNAYGGQLESFQTELAVPGVASEKIPLVFIRAPHIETVGAQVKVLAFYNGSIIAAEERNMLATAFHPELTDDMHFHRYFFEKCRQNSRQRLCAAESSPLKR